MENKEIIKAIGVAIEYYTKFADSEYSVLVENKIHNGVCCLLKSKGFECDIQTKVSILGKEFLLDNYRELKKEYNLALRRYNERYPYWSTFTPVLSTDKITMKQSLAIRLRILKAIKIQLEIL
jgi:hypothetical protein